MDKKPSEILNDQGFTGQEYSLARNGDDVLMHRLGKILDDIEKRLKELEAKQ